MIQNQLGTTLTINYPVYIEGQDSLEGLDLKLYVIHNMIKKQMPTVVEDNTVSFTFEGKDQTMSGCYDLYLVLNEGKSDQVVLVTKKVFRLNK